MLWLMTYTPRPRTRHPPSLDVPFDNPLSSSIARSNAGKESVVPFPVPPNCSIVSSVLSRIDFTPDSWVTPRPVHRRKKAKANGAAIFAQFTVVAIFTSGSRIAWKSLPPHFRGQLVGPAVLRLEGKAGGQVRKNTVLGQGSCIRTSSLPME